MNRTWIVGTRGSKLALKQTEIVVNLLQQLYPDDTFHVKTIKTTGDTVWDKPLHLIGGKGLFVKEIEEELLAGSIDFAVHSMKDMPTELDERLTIGAILKREDPRDVFLSLKYKSLADIPGGGRIGTNSLRRQSQILFHKSNVSVIPIRGNVDTRIRKMESEGLDGIILAYAGVIRMGFGNQIREILPFEIMVPPSGQGAIGIETRNEQDLLSMLGPINDEISYREVSIERNLQMRIGGGCNTPLGINATINKQTLILNMFFGKENGEIIMKDKQEGNIEDADKMVTRASEKLALCRYS
ncbi:MAG: hydroxymethylbilane synthase [Syntrophorhabdus sp.]